MAYVAGSGGRSQIWVRSLDALDARPVAGTEGITVAFFWSPDSRFIGFQLTNKLRKIDVSGGPPQALCDAPSQIRGGAWSQDGVIIFGTQDRGIWQVSEAGGTPAPLTMLDKSRGERAHNGPSFLPDGRRFVYFRDGPPEIRGIYSGTLDVKPEQQSSKRLIAAESRAIYARSPNPGRLAASSTSNDGHLLFLREGTLVAQRFDAGKGEPAGEVFPVAEGLGPNLQNGLFSVSNTGALVYLAGLTTLRGDNRLVWLDRSGKNLGEVGESAGYNVVSLSPEGTRAAVWRNDYASAAGQQDDIWVYDLSRSVPTRLTFDPAIDGWPAWSPDSSRVAFTSNRGGALDLYRKDSSGAGNDELLLKSSESKFLQDWSRDGRFLMYSQADPATMNLWVLPLDGPQGAPKTPVPYLKNEFPKSEGRFSPDGNFVAYNSFASGRAEIYVQPFPDPSKGKWQISRTGGAHPRWRRDGKELFYVSADSKMMAVETTLTPTFSAGEPKVLFPAPILGGGGAINVTRYDVTADGKKFFINTAGAEPTGAPATPITVVLNWQAGLKK